MLRRPNHWLHVRLASALLAISVAACAAVSAVAQAPADPPRLWQDASGKFQVSAQLVEQTETQVKLRTADGRIVTVPIDRLGAADQKHLKARLMPTDNPFAGGEPIEKKGDAAGESGGSASPSSPTSASSAFVESASLGVEMALPGTGKTIDLAGGGDGKPFAADPDPQPLTLPSVVVPVSTVDAYDKVSAAIPLDPTGTMAFVSIGRNVSGRPQETRGRIYAVNLKGQSSDLVWDRPAAVKVLGHDAATGRTLIVDGLDQFQRGGELVMLEGLAEGQPQILYRRSLPGAGKPGAAPQVEWAKLLPGSHVTAVVDSTLHVWDLPAARLVYRVEQVSGMTPPAISPGGNYLAVPTTGGAAILQTATGAVCGIASMGGLLKPGLAFHPAGKLLLLCAGNQYLIWDCVRETVISQATTAEQLGSQPPHWVGPRMFRAQLGDLVHLDLGMSIWKYSIPPSSELLIAGNQMLLATANQDCQLIGVPIPHASAEQALEQLMKAGDGAMLVRPGTSVAIAVEASVPGVDTQAIEDALAASAGKAGWQIANRADITLVAKIGRGEPQTLNFRSLGSGVPRTDSTATLHPFTAELEIRGGGAVLWKRSTTNHIPTILRLQEGETVQDAVKRYEKPDANFFSLLHLPPRIPKPEVSQGVGRSQLKEGQWQDLNSNAARTPGGPTGPRGRRLPGPRRP